MLKKIIDRPVLATVISIIFVILGIIGLIRIPITRFPDISPTTVMVSGSYPGGTSESVLRSVVTPLEEQINGVENMQYIRSTAANNGSFSITIVFKQGTNPDLAAINVQNRVQQATSVLPQEVLNMGLTTSKQQNSTILYLNVFTEDDSKYDELFIQNYININLVPQIKRIPGVGQVELFGSKDYSMRIWLNPQKMAAYKLIPDDVIKAISNQSLESAPGTLGSESDAPLEYIIRYRGKKNKPEDYEKLLIKEDASGLVRLKDIARIEFGSISYSSNTKVDGKNGVTLGISQNSGSNANEIEIGIREELKKAEKLFPPGLKYNFLMSTKERIDESISQVSSTLLEAFILVFIVVFLFLQDLRSTLIPVIAVPVAIIGTFFFLFILGFTINMLTLFALVLAIGIVVDDAIVVIEAVHGKMENNSISGRDATHKAMGEITGAVISITLVMAAVFIPIGFMTSSSGLFYKQFAYTLAIAILISAINALTLTPALCALILKTHCSDNHEKYGKNKFRDRFFIAFNAGFNNLAGRYLKSVKFLVSKKWLGATLIIAMIGIAAFLMWDTPVSFVPMEDDSFIVYNLTMPPGTGLDKTTKTIRKIDDELRQIKAIESYSSITGFSLLNNSEGSSYGQGFIKLKDLNKRGQINSIDSLFNLISAKLATIKEGTVFTMRNPPVDGYGISNGVEIVLQDRAGKDFNALKSIGDSTVAQIMKQPGVSTAFFTFITDYPQFELEVNEEKAYHMGVDLSSLLNTLHGYLSGDQTLNFSRFGKFYRVNIISDGEFRKNEDALNDIFVRSEKGEMVPIKSLVTFKKVYGPESVSRYNLYNSLSINVTPMPGVSNGAIIQTLENNVLNKLPSGYSYEFTGLSLEEKSAGDQTAGIILLSLLFVYVILSGKYESYFLPFAVILSIPTGIIGAFLGIRAAGLDDNIYVQVGLIMLIGLLAKNAILIIEFASQRRKAGLSIIEAAFEGAKARLRPIIMTSLAFIVGMIPLMFATGGSAVGNRSISVSAAMGMLSGVLLGLLITPILFIVFQKLHDKAVKIFYN